MYLFVYAQCCASPEYDLKCRNKQGVYIYIYIYIYIFKLWKQGTFFDSGYRDYHISLRVATYIQEPLST